MVSQEDVKMKTAVFFATFLIAFLAGLNSSTLGAPTTRQQAHLCAAGWLTTDPQPLGARIGRQIQEIETFTNPYGDPLYHVIQLEPQGFVILSGDDCLEPIVAFAEAGTYSPSADHPLGALMHYDFAHRVQTIRQMNLRMHRGAVRANGTWNRLIEAGAAGGGDVTVLGGQPGISDLRVDILVQSRWGQTTCCASPASACYNYYTPPLPPVRPDGDPANYPCGCVATAMAQVMRYHTYPSGPVAGTAYTITVDGIPVPSVLVRGGDGMGGPYNWSQMVYQPDCMTLLPERQAIGALTFDAGISVNMSYTAGGSTASLSTADQSLTNQFCYLNSIWGSYPSLPALIAMINPNLDYSHPVIVGLQGSKPEHAVVVDGYGYHYGILYHHINMGWEGLEDAWYNFYADMPVGYTTVFETVFNIFIADTAEIISGRVMDAFGLPLAGETVTAQKSTGEIYQAVTNGLGIYAMPNLPSASAYTVSVSNPNYSFSERAVSTGTSIDGAAICGNVWGVNFMPFGGSGNNYYVDTTAVGNNDGSSWPDAFNYLQDALAAASSGDRILAAEGTYKPDRSTADPNGSGDRNATFQLISGVEIYGGFPAGGTNLWSDRDIETHETILSGDIGTLGVNTDNSYHVVTGSYTDSAALLDGFTIRDGHGDYYTGGRGAGIDNYQGNAVIANCTIRNNSTDRGTGVYNYDSASTFRNCLFTENAADTYGGGMSLYYCSNGVLIEDCTFIENSAGIVGAGLENKNDSVLTVINTQFIRNSAGESGGAIYNNSTIDLINCAFLGNSVTTHYGAGFRNQVGSGQVTNCLFVGNTAGNAVNGNGGAVWNYHSNMAYRNCTFAANIAGHYGGGMYNHALSAGEPDPVVTNCIFWNNEDKDGTTDTSQIYEYGGSTSIVSYTCIQDADPDDGSIPYGGTANNNLDDNPMFDRDPDDGGDGWGDSNDDYGSLFAGQGSPCLDTGGNSQVALDSKDLDEDGDVNEPVPFTLERHGRFADGDCNGTSIVDRGAHEFAWIYIGDLDGDCDVDLDDFSILAGHWLAGK